VFYVQGRADKFNEWPVYSKLQHRGVGLADTSGFDLLFDLYRLEAAQ
jgi:hypothetical protein